MAGLPRVLLIDNDDSFTYNIVDLLRRLPCRWEVVPWRRVEVAAARRFTHLIFSPGPGLPREYSRLFSLLEELPPMLPVLGICMGHQILAVHYGGRLVNLRPPVHGQAHRVVPCAASPLWAGFPVPFQAGLYHSWAVDRTTLPGRLVPLAFSDRGVLMAFQVRRTRRFGVQFHPESYLTPEGDRLLYNFLCLPAIPPFAGPVRDG